jgi:signal transduction histidine kinase
MAKPVICRRGSVAPEALRTIPGLLEPLTAVSRMVALVSHDLRHPLSAILANAEFLARTGMSQPERNDLYREIRCAVERMNELVSSLLECSKGYDTLRPGTRNIVDTIERAVGLTCARREFRDISITHHHEGTHLGWFDANRLERVVANLVLNACEAVSAESGQIVITTKGDRAYLQIAVWDNGPGIPAAIGDSAFEPFVTYGKASGSGLGLAIAKKIVEDHGGEIALEREITTGTLFRITIPYESPKPAIVSAGRIAAERRPVGMTLATGQ